MRVARGNDERDDVVRDRPETVPAFVADRDGGDIIQATAKPLFGGSSPPVASNSPSQYEGPWAIPGAFYILRSGNLCQLSCAYSCQLVVQKLRGSRAAAFLDSDQHGPAIS